MQQEHVHLDYKRREGTLQWLYNYNNFVLNSDQARKSSVGCSSATGGGGGGLCFHFSYRVEKKRAADILAIRFLQYVFHAYLNDQVSIL